MITSPRGRGDDALDIENREPNVLVTLGRATTRLFGSVLITRPSIPRQTVAATRFQTLK